MKCLKFIHALFSENLFFMSPAGIEGHSYIGHPAQTYPTSI